jgi:hypothetical protein
MRKFVIMRGPQGSGKSTILAKTGLNRHAVSLDAIREVIGGAVLNAAGEMTITQEYNDVAWAMAMTSLDSRFKRGEAVAFDATLTKADDVETLAGKARAQNYDVLVVDRYGCDHEKAFVHNMSRDPHLRVGRTSFDRMMSEAKTTRAIDPSIRTVSTGDDLGASVEAVRAFLEEGTEIVDLSRYTEIVHVGDIQGCLAPLLASGSPLAEGLRDDVFYIFVGDLLDRGIENGGVIRWWMEHAHGRTNVRLVAGNHEDHIEIEADGREPVSKEFAKRTLPQLRESGVTREELKAIADSLVPFVAYRWRRNTVLVSHAGFPRWPQRIHLVPDFQIRKGCGHYQAPVDEAWTEWSLGSGAEGAFGSEASSHQPWQVHGHRNQQMLPIQAAARSFNLEGQVEFGGNLRFVTLGENGWTPVEVRNTVHRTMQEFRMIDVEDKRQSYGNNAPLTPWAKRGIVAAEPIAPGKLREFADNELVNECVSKSHPHVSALNFSKKAFWDKAWNAITMHTRGFYANMATGVTVARSYPKFFNLGERRETSLEALKETIEFPIVGYVKENGSLGITGYDDVTGDLVIGSKSMLDGDFAINFQRILKETLGPVGMERLLRFNRDQVASCVFEVIDPVFDPHIVEETRERVILLDVVHRHEDFETMPYQDLVKLANHLGCEVKKIAFKLDNWIALDKHLRDVETNPKWTPSRGSGPVEGVVVVDAKGFHFKVKAQFYAFWKFMRGAKDRVASNRRKGTEIEMERFHGNPEATAFVEWCKRQIDEVLEWDIVRLRKAYLADPEALIDGGRVEIEQVPDQTGFLKGVDAIAAQMDAGRAKHESVRKLVERAAEDPHRLAAFDAHPAASRLRAYGASEPVAA